MQCLTNSPTLIAEILFFLFKFGDSMLEPSMRLYIYEGVCVKEFHNFSGCEDLGAHPDWEAKVQSSGAGFLLAYKALSYIPAIILSLFAGAWCDHVGRKIPVMLPCFGTILAVLLYMMSMICGPNALLPLVLSGAAIRGIFGKSAVITMALHSYVSDVTSKEDRTKKLGRLLAMNYFGYFAGSLLAGALLGYTTYDVIFCVVVIIMALAVVVTMVFMKESVPEAFIIDSNDATLSEKARALRKSPFHIDHLKEVLEVLRRPRQGRGRLHLAVFFCIIALNQLTKSGEQDITLLFVKRYPLDWSKSLYGYLVAVDYASLGVGAMVLLPALVSLFGAGDMTLIITGLVFKVARLFMLSFADVTWMVFVAVVIGTPVAIIISGCKSSISKTVNEDEVGKVFSLLSCSDMITNLIGSLIFTSLYSSTITMYPGFVFTLDGVMYVLVLFLVLCFAYMAHRDKRLNLLYNTLDFPDYGSSGNLCCGAKESNSKPHPGAVKSSQANGDIINGADQPPVLEKRLSRISEDGVERMSVCNSKWSRNDSSSVDSISEVSQATDSATRQDMTKMTRTSNTSSQTSNGTTKLTNGNIPTSDKSQ